jgi:O-antigen ligase
MAKKKRSNPSNRGGAGSSNANASGFSGPADGDFATMVSAGIATAANAGSGIPSAPRAVKPAATKPAYALPAAVTRGDWTVILLGMMMFLAPALGVNSELMLQDTLKSIVVSFAALIAGLLFFWTQRNRREGLRWHALMWLPLALMVYALGSMVWSHTYLAGVEAIRWFIFSLLLWLGLNTITREKLPGLAWGIHMGALFASLWTALQFWVDFSLFPQGPNPASTFVNRNFFAEFVICTLPFSVLLLARAKNSAAIFFLAFTTGFNLVANLMTGTRSALVATGAMLVVLPIILVLYRKQWGFTQWDAGRRIIAIGTLIGSVLILGIIPTGNPKIAEEHRVEQRGDNAFKRAFARGRSMTEAEEYTQRSFSIRLIMWKATGRIIQARPLTGVGAGAWEVDIPLYQTAGSQLETDYYVHNEYLQLLAEYGVPVGGLFLLLLSAYLLRATYRTLKNRSSEGEQEAPYRAIALAGMLAFLIVSLAGFPWRLASTGALFALCLAMLAASDARLGYRSSTSTTRLPWQPAASQIAAVAMVLCLALAAFITERAAASEYKIVQATKLALTIGRSGDPQSPRFDKQKREMLQLIKEGTDINPHYRKITPMVADEMARWGDWKNATWVWESVVSSRPYVVAIMSNAARGHMALGNMEKAKYWLERCKKIHPDAPSVRSLDIVITSRMGDNAKALALVKDAVAKDVVDFDTANAGWVIAVQNKDYPFAIEMLERRAKGWPEQKSDSYFRMGQLYAGVHYNEAKAIEAYKTAFASAPNEQVKTAMKAQIPPQFLAKAGLQ